MKLHFFPALLPVAPVLPWLLAAVGFLANTVSRSARLPVKVRRATLTVGLGFLLAAAVLFARKAPESGTGRPELLQADQLPVAQLFAEEPARPHAQTQNRAKPQPPGAELWSVIPSRRLLGGMAFTPGGLLIVGTRDQTVDAYRLDTGTLAYRIPRALPVLSPALISPDGRRAWIGEGLHDAATAVLLCFQPEEGKALWASRLPGHIESAPSLDATGAWLAVPSGAAGVWIVNAATGETRLGLPAGHVDGTPLWLSAERLAVVAQPDASTKTSELQLWDVPGRKKLSAVPLPGMPWGAPLALGTPTRLLFTTGLGQVGAEAGSSALSGTLGVAFLEKDTLTLQRQEALGSMPLPWPVPLTLDGGVSGQGALLTLQGGEILKIAPGGDTAWRARLPGRLQGPAAAGSGKAWALDETGQLHTLDLATGKVLSSQEAGQESSSGVLFVPSQRVPKGPVRPASLIAGSPGLLLALRIE